ncbi:MAG: ThuA domain-containing protein [Bryobacteraceae bacterium]
MLRRIVLLIAMLALPLAAASDILMVCDEVPAMQTLARQMKDRTGMSSDITSQDKMPASLGAYRVVIVYIHKKLDEDPEMAFIGYAKNGGKLMLLHHSISSGKRPNRGWFPFLGISLPTGDLADGGYKYFDPASFNVVNRAPGNYVTTHKVKYGERVPYSSSGQSGRETERPAFRVTGTEIYLNHKLEGPRTILLGIKYTEPKSGKVFQQDTAGWYKKTEKGEVYYFMVGHRAQDFDIPAYAQILANAIEYRP